MAGQGVISAEALMGKLVGARKVMNKVETGSYERGHVNEEVLRSSPEELDLSQLPNPTGRPVGNVNIERINNTKLPDNIKKAMIENPISQISLNDTLDMDFLKGAKRLMEQEGLSSGNSKSQKPQQRTTSQPQSSGNIDMNAIAVMIENTVRKVMDEKLTQLLTVQQTTSINENLVIKVGDSIFKGKITGVNSSK